MRQRFSRRFVARYRSRSRRGCVTVRERFRVRFESGSSPPFERGFLRKLARPDTICVQSGCRPILVNFDARPHHLIHALRVLTWFRSLSRLCSRLPLLSITLITFKYSRRKEGRKESNEFVLENFSTSRREEAGQEGEGRGESRGGAVTIRTPPGIQKQERGKVSYYPIPAGDHGDNPYKGCPLLRRSYIHAPPYHAPPCSLDLTEKIPSSPLH